MAKLSFEQKDWWQRIEKGKLPVNIEKYMPELNKKRVDKIEQIFGNLRLADVPGQPMIREACGEWFIDLARLAAGGLSADGIQKVNQMLLMVPKKNSKSTYSALLVLSLMLMSIRPRADFLFISPTREISEIAFQAVTGAILCDDYLTSQLHIRDHVKQIVHKTSGCSMQIKTLDMKVVTGTKVTLAMLDELHLFTGKNDMRILGQLKGGMASVPEAQIIMTTTQSDIAPSGVWKAELSKARAVRDGKAKLPGYCPILYELPEALATDMDEVKKPEHWKVLNPNIDKSVSIEWLKTSFSESQSTDITEQLRWLSQHANIEISGFRLGSENQWGGGVNWAECVSSEIESIDWMIENSDMIAIGIDGGGIYDLLACTIAARLYDGRWAVHTVATLQIDALDKMKAISSLLLDFKQDGDLHILEPGDDIMYIADLITDIYEKSSNKLVGIGIDSAGLGPELALHLVDRGLTREQLISIPQGYRLNSGYVALERRIAEHKLIHSDQPLLNWNIANAIITDKGWVGKTTNKSEKIDCLVAMTNAAQILLDAPEPMPDDIAHFIS